MSSTQLSIDAGHIVLAVVLIVVIVMVCKKCSFSCGGGSEGLNVHPVKAPSCRCPKCAQAVLKQAHNGQLYGCDPNNPFVPFGGDICNTSYRKALLHGCGVA